MSRHTIDGRRYRQQRRDFLAAHTICWLCGVGGADTIDHVVPVSIRPDLGEDPSLWRPAHRGCNARRGNRPDTPRSRRSRRW